jgi:AraC-like DNA-binding protein
LGKAETKLLAYGERAHDWTQRVSSLTRVPRLLRSFGIDPAAVLAAADLPPDALEQPDARHPYLSLMRMLSAAAQATRLPHFGLLVGREAGLADIGLLGELMRHSATVGDALRTGAVLHRINSDGGAMFLFEHGSTVTLGYAVFHPNADRMATTHDLVTAMLLTAMRDLCGPAWHPTEALLPRAAPADDGPYRDHFRCPVRFDAEYPAIVFPATVMARPLPGADPARRAALEREAARHDTSGLVPQLYRSLRLLLLDGRSNGDLLAQQFAMHRRTLNRRLRAQGHTFRSILDEVRFEVARHLLGDTQLAIVQIAGALGYAEASAFTRAFRRWSGMSPLVWRDANTVGTTVQY